MSVFDLRDYDVLLKHGWKCKTYNTYKSYRKDSLIDYIRCLEHNWAGEIKGNMLLQERLEKACNHLKDKGYSLDEINKIISLEGERNDFRGTSGGNN